MAARASLTAIVSMNTSAFSRGIKTIKSGVGSLLSGATKIGGIFAGLTTGFAAVEFTKGIKEAVHFGDTLFDISKATGVSTERLAGLKFAAEQTGASFEAVTKGLAFFSKKMVAAADPTSKEGQILNELGVSVTDAAGRLRNPADVLDDFADGIARVED